MMKATIEIRFLKICTMKDTLRALRPRCLFVHVGWVAVVIAALLESQPLFAQPVREWHRKLATSIAEPVSLQVELFTGDLQIAYAREGEVSITATGRTASGTFLNEEYFTDRILVAGSGNRITIHEQSPLSDSVKVSYKIDVPYRTEVRTRVDHGRQFVTGIMGPVRSAGHDGTIKVSYVTKDVTAETDTGDLDLQVIGARISARTRRGDIVCMRAAQEVEAEADEGNITLMVVGPAKASVRNGSGRIEAGGVRGALSASTTGGDIHVKAVPHDDWNLTSISGSIRVELPPLAGFEMNAVTKSGEILIRRGDLGLSQSSRNHLEQKANGGGKRLELRTNGGRIVIG